MQKKNPDAFTLSKMRKVPGHGPGFRCVDRGSPSEESTEQKKKNKTQTFLLSHSPRPSWRRDRDKEANICQLNQSRKGSDENVMNLKKRRPAHDATQRWEESREKAKGLQFVIVNLRRHLWNRELGCD